MSDATIDREHSASVLPLPAWMKHYRSEWLKADVLAGLITAAVILPKAMAYASIAGLPVQIGLYTVLAGTVLYALLGTSQVLSVSTTTTLAILVAADVGPLASGGNPAVLLTASATLAALVGAFLLLAWALRLGFVASFISEPVLVGFKAGVGLVIILDQLPKLFGIHFHKGGFVHNLGALVQALPHTVWPTLAIAALTLLVLIGLERLLPKLPAPLVAVAVGIAAVALLGLDAHGVETVGHIPRGLPSFVPPDLSLVDKLWPGALGIALMSFTETIAAARAFAASGDPPLRPNRELLATGVANIGGALIGGMAGGGGTSQTSVNKHAGARTQLAEIVTAGGALLTMLVLAPVMGLMPEATLGAIVIVYSAPLIEPKAFRAILAIRRVEFLWAIVAMLGVVLLGTLQGIVVAIALSMLSLAYQAATPHMYVLARKRGTDVFRAVSPEHDDETFPGLLIVRPEGRLFFVNAERLGDQLRDLVEETKPQVVALDLSRVSDLEYTALKMMTDGEQRMRERGVEVWLVGLNPGVLEVVRRSPLAATLGPQRMVFNVAGAVARFQARAGGAGTGLAQGSAPSPLAEGMGRSA
jgi:high affinity sulfate transporter 1